MEDTKQKGISQDSCCSGYKDQGNPCSGCNRWEDTWWKDAKETGRPCFGRFQNNNYNQRTKQEERGNKDKFALGDGAHDSNADFRYLEEKEIIPGIKIRKNSIISLKNNRLKNREVIQQIKDLLKWKKKRKYSHSHRWIAETAFSTTKRTFGEYVSATKFDNMVREMMIKVSLCNLLGRL